jgi:hypothetical protein
MKVGDIYYGLLNAQTKLFDKAKHNTESNIVNVSLQHLDRVSSSAINGGAVGYYSLREFNLMGVMGRKYFNAKSSPNEAQRAIALAMSIPGALVGGIAGLAYGLLGKEIYPLAMRSNPFISTRMMNIKE